MIFTMEQKSFVKEWMELRGMNAYALSEIAHVSRNTLYRLFKNVDYGRYAPRKAVADALGVTIEQLRKPPGEESQNSSPIVEKEFLLSRDERDIKMRITELVYFEFTKEELKQILGYLEGIRETRIQKTGASLQG